MNEELIELLNTDTNGGITLSFVDMQEAGVTAIFDKLNIFNSGLEDEEELQLFQDNINSLLINSSYHISVEKMLDEEVVLLFEKIL